MKQGVKETQKAAKEKTSAKGFSLKAESVPSPTRVQGQRGGRPELPPRTPVRRVPFSNVQASALNMRSPQGHPLRKATTLQENMAPSNVVAAMEDRRPILTTKEVLFKSQIWYDPSCIQLSDRSPNLIPCRSTKGRFCSDQWNRVPYSGNDQAERCNSFETIRKELVLLVVP